MSHKFDAEKNGGEAKRSQTNDDLSGPRIMLILKPPFYNITNPDGDGGRSQMRSTLACPDMHMHKGGGLFEF